MDLIRAATAVVILVTLGLTLAAYPLLPPVIGSHWDASGTVNGWMIKEIGLVVVPFILLVCIGLFLLLPRIDPLKDNYDRFRPWYNGFVLVFSLTLLAVQALIILGNMGYGVNIVLFFPVIFGLLFVYTGLMIRHAEPNWFVGIRTPWTLSSPDVWRKTHERGGLLFVIAGVVSCLGALAGPSAIAFIIVPVLAVSAYTVVYSYLLFRAEERGA